MNSGAVLKGRHAVVFGAGGTIGAAVAKEFAAEGAEVFLSGRTKSSVEALAKQIAANGGRAYAAVVDTLDDTAVNDYVDGIVKQTGKIDILLDFAGPLAKDYGNGKMAVDLTVEEFLVPLATMVRSRFITARAAARHMIKAHSGVIILVTGSPAARAGRDRHRRGIRCDGESRRESGLRGQPVRRQGRLPSHNRQH